MKFKLFSVLFLFLSLIALTHGVYASAEDQVTIIFTIGSTSQLTLNETSITFAATMPMANSTVRDVEVENTGSTTLTSIYAHVFTVDNESSNPIGLTSASYAATGFLSIKNVSVGTAGTTYYYAGSNVWNNTQDTGSGWTFNLTTGASNHAFGNLWVDGSSSADLYYWEMRNGTNNQCNQTSAAIKVGTGKGSKDMTAITNGVSGSAGANWASWTFAAAPLLGYCVNTYYDCTRFYIMRYDLNSTFQTCTGSQFALYATGLTAGLKATFSLKMVVGSGVPAGATKAGALQIYTAS